MRNFGFIPTSLMLGLLARAKAQALDPPELPSNDEFYTPEASDWAEKELGKVLDSRRVNIDISKTGHNFEYEAFQLLYVTSKLGERTDLPKEPATSVTTIIVPQGANTSRILSYQIAYDAPDINCSPSYGLQPGANTAALPFTRDQMEFIGEILNDDNPPVLNMPDYEGSNAAFTVGPQSAYQTLDSIRAATSSGEITGIDEGAETILFGYSGGGYASEWAVEFHKEYAENVTIVGAAMGGPPTNIINTYKNMNMVYSPLNVWAMLGVMNALPELDSYMKADLKEKHEWQFLSRRQRCSEVEMPYMNIFANLNNWFKNGDDFLTEFESNLTEIGVLGNRISPANAPEYPLYIFQGGADEVTKPFSDTEDLKNKFCQAGTSVTMYKWESMKHLRTCECGSPWAMRWIRDVFNREEIKDSCDGSYESVPFKPFICPSPV